LRDTTVDLLSSEPLSTKASPTKASPNPQTAHCGFPRETTMIKPRKGCNVHGEWTWEFSNENFEPKRHQFSCHPNAITIVQKLFPLIPNA
jgi:hypothetical protein